MSKIICDICGTSYADTANQCPICGTVRPAESSVQSDGEAAEYTYVKGGRFSKGNVRKRNSGKEYSPDDNRSGGKIGLIVLLAVLVLIVIAIAVYVVITLIGNNQNNPVIDPAPSQSVNNPCQAIVLSNKQILLENIGDEAQLNARKSPVNSTDTMYFESSDPEIVTVNDSGKIKAIAKGTASIIITCGDVRVECEITVGTAEELPVLQLNRQEILFEEQGKTWQFYAGDIDVADIQWTSDNESVALISDGLVVAVGEGETTIHAVYGEYTASCVIKCDFNNELPNQPGGVGEDTGDLGGSGGIGEDLGDLGGFGGIGEDNGSAAVTENLVMSTNFGSMDYNNHLGAYDVTIGVGYELRFYLKAGDQSLSEVSWSIPESTTCCTLSGNVIKTISSGEVYLTAAYNGRTVKCIIRIS